MRGVLAIMVLSQILAVWAEPRLVVIYDSGDTLPIAPYLPERIQREAQDQDQAKIASPFSLPITTPSMQTGPVEVTVKALPYLKQPLFLVGADAQSRAWLSNRREQLVELGAVGLLIEAQSMQEVQVMLKIAEGLRLVPASAEDFAKILNLTHYPVLISQEGWEQ